MTRLGRSVAAASVLLLGVLLVHERPGERLTPLVQSVVPSRDFARPDDLVFVDNLGQWDTDARFVARSGAATVALADDSIDLIGTDRHEGFLLRLRLQGSRRARLEGEQSVATRYNYFLGDDREGWRSCVPAFRSVLYRGLFDGVDLRVRRGGTLVAYDLLLEPGADLSGIRIVCEGADELRLDEDGSLVMRVGRHEVRQTPPRAWEIRDDGTCHDVESAFLLLDASTYAFVASDRDATAALVVDPGLEWSTLLGGSDALATEAAYAAHVGEGGEVTIAGQTGALTFPVTPGSFDTTYNGGLPDPKSDTFIARVTPDGTALAFATFLGGTGNDEVRSLKVCGDRLGVVGRTSSPNFPVTANAIDMTLDGASDTFIACLDGTASILLFSTYLGGSGADIPSGGALDASGIAIIAGVTASADFPVTGDALSTTPFGNSDIFVARVDTVAGALLYGTYLGGSDLDSPRDAHVLGDRVAIVGETNSTDFPVTANAFQPQKNGDSRDVYALVVDVVANEIVYSSYLGSTKTELGAAVHLDENGIVTIAGEVWNGTLRPSDFPTTPGAFQTLDLGLESGFVTRMDTADGSLLYSTFVSGDFFNNPTDLAVQSSGAVTLVGHTSAGFFPVTPGALKTTNPISTDDGFVVRLRPDGSGLAYSTYLGGSDTIPEIAFFCAVALDPEGSAVVVGDTGSPLFPTTPDAFQPALSGLMDVFVSKLDMLPAGVTRLGSSTPGAAGPLAIGVWNAPQVGAGDFAIDCTDAPPLSTRGLLLVALGAAARPVMVQGIALAVDPAQILAVLPVTSDALGYTALPLRVPDAPGAAGAAVYTQFVWAQPNGPGWSATAALEIVIQP